MTPTPPEQLTARDTEDRIQQQVAGAVILNPRGEVLVLRRKPDDYLGALWELPAGKVDPGEDLITALHRETTEETGLACDEITNYLGAFDYTSGSGKTSRQHTWLVRPHATEPIVLTEHDESAWTVSPDGKPVSPEVRTLIEQALHEPSDTAATAHQD